jgi:hypothetical protein
MNLFVKGQDRDQGSGVGCQGSGVGEQGAKGKGRGKRKEEIGIRK